MWKPCALMTMNTELTSRPSKEKSGPTAVCEASGSGSNCTLVMTLRSGLIRIPCNKICSRRETSTVTTPFSPISAEPCNMCSKRLTSRGVVLLLLNFLMRQSLFQQWPARVRAERLCPAATFIARDFTHHSPPCKDNRKNLLTRGAHLTRMHDAQDPGRLFGMSYAADPDGFSQETSVDRLAWAIKT